MLSSHTQITNLLGRYAELIDAGDLEGAAHLFDHARVRMLGVGGDGTVDSAQLLESWKVFIVLYPDGTPRTKHVITNPIVDVADDGLTGTCRSYYTVFQKAGDEPLRPIINGHYRDEFEKVDGQWRFSRRHMGVDHIGDLSLHLLIDLG